MKESDLLERYALALELVPDSDLAGDLFMESRDAASLLRRANRWRERNGLPPVAMPGAVRGLSEVEREHALHLARRGRGRRLLCGVGSLLAVALLVVAGLRLLPEVVRTGLAADPIFDEAPLERTVHPKGYRIAIHKVEADPGAVTVWWSASGLHPARAAQEIHPQLRLDSITSDWMRPAEQETGTLQGRLVARTRFETFVTVEREALLTFAEQVEDQPAWLLRLPFRRQVDLSAHVIDMDLSSTNGPVTVHLHRLTLGRNYTQLRYSVRSDVGPPPTLYALQAGSTMLHRKGPILSDPTVMEVTFEALPREIDQVRLLFTPVFAPLPPRTYSLPDDPSIELYTRNDRVATIVLVVENDTWGAAAFATVEGVDGVRYPAEELSFQIEGEPPKNRVLVRAQNLPSGVALRSLRIDSLRQAVPVDMMLELPPFDPPDAKGPGD